MIQFRVGEAGTKVEWSLVVVPESELVGGDDRIANIDPGQRTVFVRGELNAQQLSHVLQAVASLPAELDLTA